ncbi:MAG: hypothetical protein ACR2H7_08490 [Actinomycetota bacterium]
MGLGHTRDVCLIDADVQVLDIDALPPERGDRFAERRGFDPHALTTLFRGGDMAHQLADATS